MRLLQQNGALKQFVQPRLSNANRGGRPEDHPTERVKPIAEVLARTFPVLLVPVLLVRRRNLQPQLRLQMAQVASSPFLVIEGLPFSTRLLKSDVLPMGVTGRG